jgi:hypothetical protein
MPESSLAWQRSTTIIEIAIAAAVCIPLWFGLYLLLPPISGMDAASARLQFALKCCCVAVLFCFVTGIEAVAHERLRSPAIDPLSGFETQRMKINLRYLQHTLEQLLVFIPGLLGLSLYCADGYTMRAVVATSVVWILQRFAFWIGYHIGPLHRAAGAPGMAMGMIVLLYVVARFGYEYAGWPGALAPLVLFGCIEAVLFRTTRPVAMSP